MSPPPRTSSQPFRHWPRRHRLAEGQGARFLAVFIDDRHYGRLGRLFIQRRLKTLGLTFVAVNDLLPRADWPRLTYLRDAHWNIAGHEAVGKALALKIKEMAAITAETRVPFARGPHPNPLPKGEGTM